MSAQPAKLYAIPISPPEEIVFEVEEGYPLVPDAIYLAICCSCEVKPTFKSLKTYLRFRIAEGEHAGKILFRAYNVEGKIIPGKGPGTGPRPKLTRGLELFKMLCRVLNLPPNTKPHRVGSRELVGQLCKIKTRTVLRDYQQKTLPEAGRYSVVDDVLSIEAGSSAPIT
jgi:hypothetical protein